MLFSIVDGIPVQTPLVNKFMKMDIQSQHNIIQNLDSKLGDN